VPQVPSPGLRRLRLRSRPGSVSSGVVKVAGSGRLGWGAGRAGGGSWSPDACAQADSGSVAARSSGRRAVKEKSAIANGFANETGSAGRRRGTPATLTEGPAWSAIRAGMPETTETGVVVLITQRQQGIPPMATRCTTARSAASRPGRSASRSSGPLTSPIRRAVPVACPIRWSIEGNHGHARTAPLASRLA